MPVPAHGPTFILSGVSGITRAGVAACYILRQRLAPRRFPWGGLYAIGVVRREPDPGCDLRGRLRCPLSALFARRLLARPGTSAAGLRGVGGGPPVGAHRSPRRTSNRPVRVPRPSDGWSETVTNRLRPGRWPGRRRSSVPRRRVSWQGILSRRGLGSRRAGLPTDPGSYPMSNAFLV